MISLDLLYYIVGILFLVFGILSFSNQAKDIKSRISGGVFWISYIYFFTSRSFTSFCDGLYSDFTSTYSRV